MSLWRYKGSIAHAIAGDLSGAAEMRLRSHLKTCARCRDHYNTLSALSQVGGTNPGGDREKGRLMHALTPPALAPEPITAKRWLWALPVLIPAAAFALWVRLQPPAPVDVPTWRGSTAEPERWPLSLLIYGFNKTAAPDTATPEVLGELPFSQGIAIGKDVLVQFGYKALQLATYLSVVGEQGGQRVTLFPRRPQDNLLLSPSNNAKPLGTSLDLNAAFHDGPVQLWIVLSPNALSPAELHAAVEQPPRPSSKNLRVYKESLTLTP